jgi:subtilisin family serine protease
MAMNFHLKKTFNNDVLKSKVDFYSYSANPNMWGQSITLWGEPTKNFSVGVSVTNTSNVLLNESIYYNSSTTTNYIDTFLVIGTDTVFYNLSMENANPLNNRPHARFRIKNTNTAYRIVLNVSATNGTVHAWNVTELTNGVGNWGMPFSLGGAGTTFGDANYGIGEPSCTESVISVAAHSSQYALPSGTLTGGAIATFSSYGPTLDERSKPDISAPGVNVCSSVSSFTDNSFSNAQTVSFNGTDYKFTRISGTSMSSPMVTGVVALILEANHYLMPWQVKDIIRQSARTDSYTGVIPTGGSLRWGMGKLDAYEAIKLALNTVSIDQIEEKSFVKVFPNPTTGLLYIQGNLKGNETFQLIGLDGKILLNGQLEIGKLDLSTLQTGMYILKIHSNGGDKSVQVIKE